MKALREFKQSADEILKDIHVTGELKDKVRARCNSGKRPRNYWSLIPAASFVLIMALGVLLGSLNPKPGAEQLAQDNTHIMATQRAVQDGVWRAESLLEAESAYGKPIQTPGYVPKGYALESVQVYGEDGEDALGVALHYTGNEKPLIIRQERETAAVDLSGLERIERNGKTFYVQWRYENAAAQITLHWRSEGILYAIEGPLPEEEAIKIALSMKSKQ